LTILALVSIASIILAYFLERPLALPTVSNYIQISNDGHPKIVSFLGYAPLLTDGTRLYLSQLLSGAFTLAEVSSAGGETVQVQSPVPNTYLLDISPDHTQLLVLDFGEDGLDPPFGRCLCSVGRLIGSVTSWATLALGLRTDNG